MEKLILKNLSNNELLKYKKELEQKIIDLDIKQISTKVNINSCYGVQGSPYFRFYNNDIVEAVTKTGQLYIQYIQKNVNDLINKICKTKNIDYCIASDTDSIFLHVEQIVNLYMSEDKNKEKIVSKLDQLCKDIISPFIQKQIKLLNDYLNGYMDSIEVARDTISDRGVFVAKKKYALNVWDSEGVRNKEPKLKIMGIEVQRSSTPKACREKLKEAIKIILTQDQPTLINHIQKFKEEFYKLKPDEVAFPRGVNGMTKYYDRNTIYSKGTPIAVKGALLHNELLDKMNLNKKYMKIVDADKVKFLYLREPNITQNAVIAFSRVLPKEFGLDKFVDYDLQFEKTFLDPLHNILDIIKWKHEEVNTLEGFFS